MTPVVYRTCPMSICLPTADVLYLVASRVIRQRLVHRVRKKGATLFLPVTLRNAN